MGGFSHPGPRAGPRDLVVLKHSSYRLIFQCPLSLVSDLHICWNTVGCSSVPQISQAFHWCPGEVDSAATYLAAIFKSWEGFLKWYVFKKLTEGESLDINLTAASLKLSFYYQKNFKNSKGWRNPEGKKPALVFFPLQVPFRSVMCFKVRFSQKWYPTFWFSGEKVIVLPPLECNLQEGVSVVDSWFFTSRTVQGRRGTLVNSQMNEWKRGVQLKGSM